jgi:hypothetical protein
MPEVTKQVMLQVTRKYCDSCVDAPELEFIDNDNMPPFTHQCMACSTVYELAERYPLFKNVEVAI